MNIPPINLKAQFKGVRKDIFKGIREILDEQRLILGRYCQELEDQVSSMTGAAQAISCANGTDALILSLMALGVGQGDEVVTTPYSFFSTASSIALVGARPVFADIQDGDMNIDPAKIEKAITPKTKAIIVVHLFGKICDMKRILAIAEKLGMGEKFSEGKTTKDLMKDVYDTMDMADLVSWQEFQEKKCYVYAPAKDWEQDPPGLRKFYEDPVKNPLPTPSGLLEFYSERLAKLFPDDKERPPFPQWIEKGVTHDERLSSERAAMFPLLLMSNHGRWRTHAQGDDITWTRETPTGKVLGSDGYRYEPVWINPGDAAKRGIKDGDIVKVFNERGVVLCGARVWERMSPGTVYVDHGARHDPIIDNVDRGGAINTISPDGLTSKNACGQATTAYLVDVQLVTEADYKAWRAKDPESFDAAFKRDYDPAYGPRFNGWVEGGME